MVEQVDGVSMNCEEANITLCAYCKGIEMKIGKCFIEVFRDMFEEEVLQQAMTWRIISLYLKVAMKHIQTSDGFQDTTS